MMDYFTRNDLHDIVEALATALDAKHSSTLGHSERVAELSELLAKHLGLSAAEREKVHVGAHLHDIGKIGIPDAVLDKPGKLTRQDFLLFVSILSLGMISSKR